MGAQLTSRMMTTKEREMGGEADIYLFPVLSRERMKQERLINRVEKHN